jgi:hypothetical protein
MDHTYIDEHLIAERYLQGKLSPEEAAVFQEHSLSCAECLDRLETAETLQEGLRRIAAQEVATAAVRTGLLARAVRSRFTPWVTTFLLVAALLPAGLLWRRADRLEGELAALRASPRPERTEPPRPAPASAPDTTALDDLRRQLDGERQNAARERAERERLARELREARSAIDLPVINLPVVPLSPERSGEEGAAPTHRIVLSPETGGIVLSLELADGEAPRDAAGYRATLRGPRGAALWQAEGLVPDATGTLHLSLPASLLPAGDLAIEIDRPRGRDAAFPVARFPFRIVQRR